MQLALRQARKADLELFFQFQLDEQANYLAAFTSNNQADKAAYLAKYAAFLNNPLTNTQAILVEGVVVGSIAKFEVNDEAEITYWIDRTFWARGIATRALGEFLLLEKTRPIFGRVAFDNVGSQRVLEKCGFIRVGTDEGFANARRANIVEFIYRLA